MSTVCEDISVCVHVSVMEPVFLRVTVREADVVFWDTPRAPAINDDNLNFDTRVFAEATGLDELRKSPI